MTGKPILNENGVWIIPATQRPDGSWRKEIVVKQGYLCPDEVQTYKIPAKRSNVKEIGSDVVNEIFSNINSKTSFSHEIPKKETNPINMKVDKSKLEDEEELKNDIQDITKSLSILQTDERKPGQDPMKKLKGLKKKLREIEQIITKKNQGHILTPEQEDKILRKSEIQYDIQNLEKSEEFLNEEFPNVS